MDITLQRPLYYPQVYLDQNNKVIVVTGMLDLCDEKCTFVKYVYRRHLEAGDYEEHFYMVDTLDHDLAWNTFAWRLKANLQCDV